MRIPGIQSVGYAPCAALQPHIVLKAIAGEPVTALAAFTRIRFCDIPVAKKESETDDGGGEIETATLIFTTETPLPSGRFAFEVTDMAGRLCLIGSKEPPYPRISVEYTTGLPGGDPAVYKYTITHKALKTLIANF